MLKIGDPIPDVSLPNQENILVSLQSFRNKKPLVIYFYPKNNTLGCTLEACTFRDNYNDFAALGAEVIGISGDSVSSHKRVREKRKLPFLLLSDQQREAEKAFGVPRNILGMLPGRVTFVVDKNGIIVDIFTSAIRPAKHVSVALKSLQNLSD